MADTTPDTRRSRTREGWNSSLRSLFSLVIVAMLIVVSATLVGLDYHRSRNAAIADAEANMRGFMNRLVDRLGVLSGDTSALVNLVSSVANSFLVPPPERMNDKVAVLREASPARRISTVSMSAIPTARSFRWSTSSRSPGAWHSTRRVVLPLPCARWKRMQTASLFSACSSWTRTGRNFPTAASAFQLRSADPSVVPRGRQRKGRGLDRPL